jgi:hypothetical protein
VASNPITPESPDSIFGPMVSGYDVEMDVARALQKWIDTYMIKAERHHGLPDRHLARPRSIRVSTAIDKLPEDQLPCIVVTSMGTAEDAPSMNGESDYDATWEVHCSFVAAAKGVGGGFPLAMQYARMGALAVRGVVVQQQGDRQLPGFWDWQRERYDVVDEDGERTIAAGRVYVWCQAYQTIRRWGGPMEPYVPPEDPDVPPGPDPVWPLAETMHVSPPILVPTEEKP